MSAVVIDGWQSQVRVTDERGATEHEVGVGELGSFLRTVLPYPGFSDIKRLVCLTVEFLLEREPRDAISPKFVLNDFGLQSPDYQRVTRIRLLGPISGH